MIKKMAWNTFKNTGNVNTFLELRQIQNIEQQIENEIQPIGKTIEKNIEHHMEEQNGNNKNEWYNNI